MIKSTGTANLLGPMAGFIKATGKTANSMES